jgi:hypothetical protein
VAVYRKRERDNLLKMRMEVMNNPGWSTLVRSVPIEKRDKVVEKLQKDVSKNIRESSMRFGPVFVESSIRDALYDEASNSPTKVTDFANVAARWSLENKKNKKNQFSDEQILRFVRFAGYKPDRALSIMKRAQPRHFKLTAMDQLVQLRTKTLFPIPTLKTLDGHSVLYMKPSRFNPKNMSTSALIDNLVYVMDTYAAPDPDNRRGMAFIANMDDWGWDNFSIEYCRAFMQILQGRAYPAKVQLFLIVNPPNWFGKVWSIMKGMLSISFQKKVHLIAGDEVGFFFMPGYEDYLPDEFLDGKASTDDMVEDFIQFRHAMEVATGRVSKRRAAFLLGNAGLKDGSGDTPSNTRKTRAQGSGMGCRSLFAFRGGSKDDNSNRPSITVKDDDDDLHIKFDHTSRSIREISNNVTHDRETAAVIVQ